MRNRIKNETVKKKKKKKKKIIIIIIIILLLLKIIIIIANLYMRFSREAQFPLPGEHSLPGI